MESKKCVVPGRPVCCTFKEVTIAQSNAEHTEMDRGHSSRETKDRISRCECLGKQGSTKS